MKVKKTGAAPNLPEDRQRYWNAYMLFYEKVDASDDEVTAGPSTETEVMGSSRGEDEKGTFDLSPALEEWIWQDNKNFIQDNNIFDHSYFA